MIACLILIGAGCISYVLIVAIEEIGAFEYEHAYVQATGHPVNIQAMIHLAMLNETGMFCVQNEEKARYWYTRAANYGNETARIILKKMLNHETIYTQT